MIFKIATYNNMISKKKIFVLTIITLVLILGIFLLKRIFVEQEMREATGFGHKTSTISISPQVSGDTFFQKSGNSETALGLEYAGNDEAIPSSSQASQKDSSENTIERMIIKTGRMALEVLKVEESIAKIRSFAEENGGFVVNSEVGESDSISYGSITIRIPSEKFDQGLGIIRTFAKKVVEESVDGQDVTEEYYDSQAELRNLKATETQFLKILERANSIPDILAVEKELKNIRSEIDILQGRLQYLSRSVKLSTITVSISTDESVLPVVSEDEWQPLTIIKNALRGLTKTARTLFYALIWIVIFAPIWLPLGLLIRWLWNNYKNYRQKKSLNH